MPQVVLTNLERRALANLSIPRNVDDLHGELRADPHVEETSPSDLNDLLRSELAAQGWVVNLGEHTDMAKLASAVEKHKTALTMPDEKARIFARRLADPRRAWRVKGDVWMLTDDGVAKLHEPDPNAPTAPLTPSQLRAVIEAERARIASDVNFVGSIHDRGTKDEPWRAGGVLLDPDTGQPYTGGKGPTLHDRLLVEEFAGWLDDVLQDYDRRYSDGAEFRKSLNLPMAGGAGWTDAYENTILDAENQKTTITAAAPWYMCLSILAFTDADTGTTADDGTHKPTYTGYARKSVAAADMAAAAAGSAANANPIQFAACTGGTSTIVAFGNCDAATVGLLRKYGTCSSLTVSTTQTPAVFNAGSYTTTAD